MTNILKRMRLIRKIETALCFISFVLAAGFVAGDSRVAWLFLGAGLSFGSVALLYTLRIERRERSMAAHPAGKGRVNA